MATTPQGEYIPTANTKLLLHLNGNSNDSSGNGNNGTDTAIVYSKNNALLSNQVAEFNGTSSKITIPYNSNLNFGTGNHSFIVWVYPKSFVTQQMIFKKGIISSTTSHCYARQQVGGSILFNFVYGNDQYNDAIITNTTLILNQWNCIIGTYNRTSREMLIYFNGKLQTSTNYNTATQPSESDISTLKIGWDDGGGGVKYYNGNIDEVIIEDIAWTPTQVLDYYTASKALFPDDKTKYISGINADSGTYPSADNNSLDTGLVAWKRLQVLLKKSVDGGQCFSNGIVSTYPLVYFSANAYTGAVLSPNGDIHFTPTNATVGQKISSIGLVSTYSLVKTGGDAYYGGVLMANGEIHLMPNVTNIGQKISLNGVVSTYSMIGTVNVGAAGGCLDSNGNILMANSGGVRGHKISSTGVVSTYSLVYTTAGAYAGCVLAPNGDVHMIPMSATVGQKISSSGVVSTYSLVYTLTNAYFGGVLSPNGDIHFIPYIGKVGQKISTSGLVSTYSLVYTSGNYIGGVLAPNGDIHLIPLLATVGQKININGVVSTYALLYTSTTVGMSTGGVLSLNGDIYFAPNNTLIGQKISTLPAIPFDKNICLSPFFNKF